MKRYGYIYKHVNKENGHVYIGQSIQDPKRRFRKTNANYASYKTCPAMYAALLKYTWNGFVTEIVEWADSQEELNALEEKYITLHNSADGHHGYNTTSFSEGRGVQSEETKKKIGKKRKEYYQNLTEPVIAPNLKEHIFENGIEKKFCSGHKTYHPLEDFTKHASRWDGLHHYCKEISKEKTRAYRIKKPAKKLSEEEWKASYKDRKKPKDKFRYFARKCTIQSIDIETQRKFLSENHRQNYVPCQFAYGLFFQNELVSLMTFGTPRFTDEYQYELLRFCSKRNTYVIGGASKLYTYFIRNHQPKSIISYANKAYSKGNLYEILGMQFSHGSQNSYYYEKNGIHLSRYKCQKHKLPYLLGALFDPNKTEEQNMKDAGYNKIIIPGNLVYFQKFN